MNHLRAVWATRIGMAGVDPSAEIAFMDRLGRCYELAGRYVTDPMMHRNEGATLVHGSIEGMGNPRIGHAWVVDVDGEIFEPTSGKHFDSATFKVVFHPIEYVRYDGTEARVNILKLKHWGPWDDKSWGS